MCPPGYHHSRFVATHTLRHMMYSYSITYTGIFLEFWKILGKNSVVVIQGFLGQILFRKTSVAASMYLNASC